MEKTEIDGAGNMGSGIAQKKALEEKGEPRDIRYVEYIQDGDIGRVRISRPEALNALNSVVVKQIDEAFAQAESDPRTKAIIIEAMGKAFVAGADIKFFVDCIKADKVSDIHDFTAHGQEVFNKIDDSKKLVVAKMEGLALGGGLELALTSDVIVATPKATMGFPETGIGIYPCLGGTQRTSRFVGKALGKYIVFSGRNIDATTAESIGLVDYVFEPDEIDNKIVEMIHDGTLKPNKGKDKLPEEWQKIKEFFADENIQDILEGKYLGSDDPLKAKIAKAIAKKAPLGPKFANKVIDSGYEKTVKEGMKDELADLCEIFSTKDAFTGLTNVGKKDIKFEGK